MKQLGSWFQTVKRLFICVGVNWQTELAFTQMYPIFTDTGEQAVLI